jgi:hypothetical protein
VHTEAAVFSESLKMVAEEQSLLVDSCHSIDEGLAKLSNQMKENVEICERNFDSLNARLDKLFMK